MMVSSGFFVPPFRPKTSLHNYGLKQQFLSLDSSVSLSRSCVRASSNSSSNSSSYSHIRSPPLRPETPAGQFLFQTLNDNRHLFHAAVELQLESLVEERDSQVQPANRESPDYVLYKRISQLRAKQQRRAVQEVIYALVVQRFIKSGIIMVPKIWTLAHNKYGGAAWVSERMELERIHSPEALGMIKEYLQILLGGPKTLKRVEPHTVGEFRKVRVGEIYVATVMCGYFLKRVDERYQLEKKMKILTTMSDGVVAQQTLSIKPSVDSAKSRGGGLSSALSSALSGDLLAAVVESLFNTQQVDLKPNELRAYVKGFDQETRSRYANMRTQEAVDLIKRHAEALFGHPNDDMIQITFRNLQELLLEAAAFGSHLWEMESFVDTHYSLVPSK